MKYKNLIYIKNHDNFLVYLFQQAPIYQYKEW